MITFESKGSFNKTNTYLKRIVSGGQYRNLQRFAEKGRQALIEATPKDSEATAHAWECDVIKNGNLWEIVWYNTHRDNDFPVAIMLQYGHGTRNGGYVQGRNYINPAIRPIFDEIADSVWKEVTRA